MIIFQSTIAEIYYIDFHILMNKNEDCFMFNYKNNFTNSNDFLDTDDNYNDFIDTNNNPLNNLGMISYIIGIN